MALLPQLSVLDSDSLSLIHVALRYCGSSCSHHPNCPSSFCSPLTAPIKCHPSPLASALEWNKLSVLSSTDSIFLSLMALLSNRIEPWLLGFLLIQSLDSKFLEDIGSAHSVHHSLIHILSQDWHALWNRWRVELMSVLTYHTSRESGSVN